MLINLFHMSQNLLNCPFFFFNVLHYKEKSDVQFAIQNACQKMVGISLIIRVLQGKCWTDTLKPLSASLKFCYQIYFICLQNNQLN
jgi:hypothetical protein